MTAHAKEHDYSIERLRDIVSKLSGMSVRDHYNVFEKFDWPESIEENQPWMSRDLLTVYGTEDEAALSEEELNRLSKWESINFYSLNVHGIRELLAEVVQRIHMPGYETITPYLHHFLGEENDHMWFFAEFCLRYGGKLYPNPNVSLGQQFSGKALDMVTFAKIQLFEEIVDHFNKRVAEDASIDPFIREINRVHHRDESRHIAFGRELVLWLYEDVRQQGDEQVLRDIESYLRGYVINSVNMLYNPKVYQDAGLPGDAFERRKRLLQDEKRQAMHKEIARKPENFLLKYGLISEPIFAG